MIKGVMTDGKGQRVLILGIEKKNVENLEKGHPIHVKGADVDLPIDVVVLYGETLRDVYADLKKNFELPDVVNIQGKKPEEKPPG